MMHNKLPQIPTGSQLVAGVEPADKDYVEYVPYDTLDAVLDKLGKAGWTIQTDNEYKENPDSPSRFVSCKCGHINLILTSELELYYRFKAFSGVLKLMQITNKDMRKIVASACLYWEPEK